MKCAKCGQAIAETGNRVAVKIYGGRAEFHFACFDGFLRDGAAEELERLASAREHNGTTGSAGHGPGTRRKSPG